MGEISHQVTRFSEQMIVFGSSFDGARFGSVGAMREEIAGQGVEQSAIKNRGSHLFLKARSVWEHW